MPAGPRLTVALPTYNGARHLRDALRSILAQERVAFDLLVCDDRSDDETVEIVRHEAADRARVIVSTDRLGLAGNWNRCVAESRTELVAVFHQDDVMRPGHLRAHVEAFGHDAGMVVSATGVIDEQGEEVPECVVGRGGLGPEDRRFAPGAFVREMLVENLIRCSGVTLRKEAHRALGGFDPSFRYVVDWDFWLRLGDAWSVAWLAEPTVDIRWHLGSETHRFKTGTTDLDETLRLLEPWWSWQPDPSTHRTPAEHRLGRAFLNRAYVGWKAGDYRLAREAFRRARSLWPGVWTHLSKDPKLAGALALSQVTPGWLSRHCRDQMTP